LVDLEVLLVKSSAMIVAPNAEKYKFARPRLKYKNSEAKPEIPLSLKGTLWYVSLLPVLEDLFYRALLQKHARILHAFLGFLIVPEVLHYRELRYIKK